MSYLASANTAKNCGWYEENGVIKIRIIVTSGGNGKKRLKSLINEGFRIRKCDKKTLIPVHFKKSLGLVGITVLKGNLFADEDRTGINIRREAKKRKLVVPSIELVYLLRENFSDEDIAAMGLWWIVVMHRPVVDANGNSVIVDVGRASCNIGTSFACPDRHWDRNTGFAFIEKI